MDEFARTRRGAKFFDGDVPRIATALEKIASELDRRNTEKALVTDVGPSDVEDGDRFRRWCDVEECEERAVLHRCKHHAKSFVEMVWIVCVVGLTPDRPGAISVRASEQSARDIVRDRIKDDAHLALVAKNSMLHDLAQWDGQHDVTIGPWLIRVEEVDL